MESERDQLDDEKIESHAQEIQDLLGGAIDPDDPEVKRNLIEQIRQPGTVTGRSPVR